MIQTLRRKDSGRFRYTIETNPAYGKYHWSGHRNCNISLPPNKAKKYGNRCPSCGTKLTMGVEQRIEELADRPADFTPENAIGYKRLLPLHEIVKSVLGASYPGTKSVWNVYNSLTASFGDEYTVLMDASEDEMSKIVDSQIAEAIIRVRTERAKVIPGYDGVYGELVLFEEEKVVHQEPKQKSMSDFL